MKKAIVCALAALALVAFAQPLEERAKAWFAPNRRNEPNAPGVTFESQLGVKQESNLIDVTLYFRYGDTNLLGAVGAQLDMRREETVAQSIVEALLVGPDAAHDRLSGVFPQGTEVISVQSVSDTGVMLAACARDEQAILTPKSALELMLAAWQKQDWEALYALVLREEETPTLSGFESQMRETNVQLMTYESTSGTVSLDGQRATVVLDAAIHSDEGGDAQIVRESVPLIRQSDNWCVALATLESLMIRD